MTQYYTCILQAKTSTFEHVETWCNRKWLPSSLGNKIPVEEENTF